MPQFNFKDPQGDFEIRDGVFISKTTEMLSNFQKTKRNDPDEEIMIGLVSEIKFQMDGKDLDNVFFKVGGLLGDTLGVVEWGVLRDTDLPLLRELWVNTPPKIRKLSK